MSDLTLDFRMSDLTLDFLDFCDTGFFGLGGFQSWPWCSTAPSHGKRPRIVLIPLTAKAAGHPMFPHWGGHALRSRSSLFIGIIMQKYKAAIVGGLIAGVVTTAAMVVGRKTGLLTKTLDRDAVDWIDDVSNSRAVIGDAGTSAVEFVNHLGASAAFAAAVPPLRELAPGLSPVALGTLYGTALYAVNIGAIAPFLGITEGEIKAGPRKAAERWAIHVLQAVVTAVVAERLTNKTRYD